MRMQEHIDPLNVVESYKKLLEENYFGNDLPKQMIEEIINKIKERKNA
jgi:hypothetical protein